MQTNANVDLLRNQEQKMRCTSKRIANKQAKTHRNAKQVLINNQQKMANKQTKMQKNAQGVLIEQTKAKTFTTSYRVFNKMQKRRDTLKNCLKCSQKCKNMRNQIKGVQQTSKNAEKRQRSAYKQPAKGWPRNKQTRRETLNEGL